MGESSGRPRPVRTRREPPPFRPVTVARVEHPTPWLVRVTVDGPDLADIVVNEPAASVRLLLPSAGKTEVIIPEWNGNEFLLEDGSRPILRTFTPIRPPGSVSALTLDVVRHDGGAASDWAVAGVPGLEAAISGPGRGYTPDPAARAFLLTGDESAVPAMSQLVAALAPRWPVRVGIEVRSREAVGGRLADTAAEVDWCVLDDGTPPGTAQFAYVQAARIESGTRIWAAGEAAAMQRLRRHLFNERDIARSETMVRGYWKRSR